MIREILSSETLAVLAMVLMFVVIVLVCTGRSDRLVRILNAKTPVCSSQSDRLARPARPLLLGAPCSSPRSSSRS